MKSVANKYITECNCPHCAIQMRSRLRQLEAQNRRYQTALNNIIWAVNVAIAREGSSEGKVRIGGIAQSALREEDGKSD